MVAIDVAVHVGDLELGFVDGGFERHAGRAPVTKSSRRLST
jgi:ethanolamine utilization microcompartment shell protein EutS